MRKSILFIAQDSSLYGANQSLINMLSSIRLEDIRITVVFPERGPICDTFDQLKWEYHLIFFRTEAIGHSDGFVNNILNGLRYLYKKLINPISLFRLWLLTRINNVNIIHSNSSIVSIGEQLSRITGIRHVWHLREYIDLDHNINICGGIEKYKTRIQNSDQVICITKGIAKHFKVENKALVLYDAVRMKVDSRVLDTKSNYFLFCGSLAENKGVEIAINSFSKIKSNNAKLLIVGTGELNYEIYLSGLVDRLNLRDKIEFLGFRTDIDELMSKAISLLMCSKSEALGRVTIEAMLNKCVVIGFNNAGTKEIIENNKTGLLYDNEDQLVEFMNVVIDEQIDLNVMRELAYNYACSNFLEAQFAKRLLAFYNLD